MRRAQVNMSWSDSMSSSITLTGSRANVARQHRGSRLRQTGDPTLQRLVRELHASRIEEEPEDEIEEMAAAAQPRIAPERANTQPLNNAPASTSSSTSSSRGRRMLIKLQRKARQLARLVSYYLSRMLQEYAATNVVYRPLQMGMY
ncbi:hypothetical protein GGI05_003430 [Coemansia sp. RSA 2603]|nr:hypothetical protein GGI05_003430 [Coemansia sp. RSA 2603]